MKIWLMLGLLLGAQAHAEEMLVKLKEVGIEKNVAAHRSTLERRALRHLRTDKNMIVVLGDPNVLKNDPAVAWAEANYPIHLDPVHSSVDERAWGVDKIQAPKAWDMGSVGSDQILVAVIDTGVDYNHPALKDHIWTNPGEIAGDGVDNDKNGFVDDVHGYNFADKKGDPMDDNKHGTHVSGTIVGVDVGVAQKCRIMGVKFLDASGSGTLADAVDAINYATLMGARVMSNSWGGGGYSKSMEEAIKKAGDAGAVFIAAAGNNSSDNDKHPSYPASYKLDNVISVAATDADDKLASFSNYGKKTVHVAAPGVKIYSSVPDGKYDTFSGTSMATPHVTGMVVLMLAAHPELTPKQVKEQIMSDKLPLSVVAGGRVNAYKTLKAMQK